jgi:glucose/arabinose dehydrogenase
MQLLKNGLKLLFFLLMALLSSTSSAEIEYRLETYTSGLSLPWSIAFLPDGSALVTELGGRLRRIDSSGQAGEEIKNVPAVYFGGQGGLFDVLLHPDFGRNSLVYLSYAEGSPANNGTTVARGKLVGNRLEEVTVIYRTAPRKDTPVHYGGRMAFLADGTLLLTSGEGFNYREAAQDIASGLGKLIRMNDDGSPAQGNPFEQSPYVYSYGHRNPQGLAVSSSGVVWLHEHGPRGGDELNRIEPGVNYGWPAITYGLDYSGAVISPFTEWEGMAQPEHYWVPSIAPSGLTIYEGDLFPEWKGDLFLGALVSREVRRLDLINGEVVAEETLFSELDDRIRDVRSGPDGAIYILTSKKIVRIVPVNYSKTKFTTAIQVSGGVYMLQGGAGNAGALLAEDEIILVDDAQAPRSAEDIASLTGNDNRPALRIINSGWYSENTQNNESLTLETKDETITIYGTPRAHSANDIIAHFSSSDVIYMGNIFTNGSYPELNHDNGGSIQGMIGAVQLALGLCDTHTRVIPGRGALANCADLEEYGEILYDAMKRIRGLLAQGKSIDEIIAARPIEFHNDQPARGRLGPDSFVEFIYESLQE